MHIVGETITLVTVTGGGIDRDGYRIPREEHNEPVEGAVVIPEQSGRITDDDRAGEFREASVLLPRFVAIETGSEVVVRGQKFRVDRPPFDHRSAFGTRRGGTEIYLRRATG